MAKRIYKLSLAWVGLLFIFTINNGYATRIYGGHYTAERINNLRNNCSKYEWAKQQLNAAQKKAAPWLDKTDETLWMMVPGQSLPRTIDVAYYKFATDAKFTGCIVCGDKIFQYGNYPYNPDFEHLPWKLTCPSCGAIFPTNDFGKYYQSGIDEQGLFNPLQADTGLLFNTAHPDPNDPLHKFGVDDGFGYPHDGRAYKYIGYYTWKYWIYIYNGVAALADAFLYTGEQQYAHKAAILLDRIADIYPSMDWKPYAERGWYHSDGGTGRGKIEGAIWETGVVQKLADAYDKILSGTQNDPALYAFLKKQSEKHKLPTPKGTRYLFTANVDSGILKTAFQAVLSQQIRGNQGMYQLTAATCAIALNTEPLTTQWLDWVFTSDGGAISELMINRFDRDGTSDEGAPGYAFIWGREISVLASLLVDYPQYTNHNIFRDFPQFKNTYTAAYKMAVLGKAIPNIGDAGATGLVNKQAADPVFMATGYLHTRDPAIAIAAYRANGNTAKGLGLDIFSPNPEWAQQEIQRIGERAGPRPLGGYLMSGFGLALLESGNTTSGTALANNYGRTKMHAHRDMLNFDIFAFGLWLAPDLGYPEFATNIPSTTEWTKSTISHNTVIVNQQPQQPAWGGHTKLFAQLNNFGVLELDGKSAYPGIEEYTRTMFLVDGANRNTNDTNAYIIDFFRVKGGHDHVFSFHGPPGAITSQGLQLHNQEVGTYAGKSIAKGSAANNFPMGYSFLYNVQKDSAPPPSFVIDWKVADGYRGVRAKDNIHLRMHAITACSDVALANGDPPQNKPGNPQTLHYVLMHRSGTDLGSSFITVFEPYQHTPFIKSVQRMDDSAQEGFILKVEKVNGHTDYLLYNPTSKNIIKLTNGLILNGAMGYIKVKNDQIVKAILLNGTSLDYGKLKLKSSGAIEGKVVAMDKGFSGNGWLVVEAKQPINKTVIGKQIIIETTGERDATYQIHDFKKEGKRTRLFCGPVTFANTTKNNEALKNTATQIYHYDFEEGAAFNIASYTSWDKTHQQ